MKDGKARQKITDLCVEIIKITDIMAQMVAMNARLQQRVTALEAKNGSLTPKAAQGRRFNQDGEEIL